MTQPNKILQSNLGGVAVGDYSDPRPVPPASGSGAPLAAIFVVAAPTGNPVQDLFSWQAAMARAAAAGGGLVIAQPGVYSVAPTTSGAILYPNNVTIMIPAGTAVLVPPNTTTANHSYNLFAAASDPCVNVHFVIDGVIDGNIANGNHGPTEFIFGINFSDAQGSSIAGGGKITNWRGEAIYGGHSASTAKDVFVGGGLSVINCGVKQAGDGGNPRQGIAFTNGSDITVDGVHFDTIGAYALDFEGSTGADSFDGVVAGPANTYRNVGMNGAGGAVNLTAPGGVSPSCRVYPGQVSGSGIAPFVNSFVVPAGVARKVMVKRTSGDLTLNSNAWVQLPGAWDVVMPANVGDIISWEPNFNLTPIASFTSFDVATIVSAAPANYFSSGGAAQNAGGVAAWRYNNSGDNTNISGRMFYVVQAADIVGGQITLRPYYKQNTAVAQTLFGSAGGAGAMIAAALVENLGPGL